jgi:beta-lactamase regulating signal transducer with metallopeptidase domain
MFAARGIAVSFSIFFIFYSLLSLAVCLVWRRVSLYGQRFSARRCGDLLFALRMAPLAVGTGVTLIFAVPSFLLLEPRAVEESVGILAAVLGCGGMAVMLAGAWNAVTALVRATRTVALWSSEARVMECGAVECGAANSRQSVAVMRTSAVAPPLTAAGILRPRVWLSGAAEFVLTERELRCALRHEVVHVRRRDNLRKLFLRMVAFPGMAQLESEWREAAEMAADDAAVSNASEALDLAAAVIKLSRLAPLQISPELTTGLVHSPAESVNARVERLIGWTEARQSRASGYSFACVICAIVAAASALALTYSSVLVHVHQATEWLVR